MGKINTRNWYSRVLYKFDTLLIGRLKLNSKLIKESYYAQGSKKAIKA